MGWHECEYISREDAKALGLRHADFANSSGDVTLSVWPIMGDAGHDFTLRGDRLDPPSELRC